MRPTIPVSLDHLKQIEQRIGTLEQVVRNLARVVQSGEHPDTFTFLYQSKSFEAHKKEILDRFKNDPSQFVDPFATYQTK